MMKPITIFIYSTALLLLVCSCSTRAYEGYPPECRDALSSQFLNIAAWPEVVNGDNYFILYLTCDERKNGKNPCYSQGVLKRVDINSKEVHIEKTFEHPDLNCPAAQQPTLVPIVIHYYEKYHPDRKKILLKELPEAVRRQIRKYAKNSAWEIKEPFLIYRGHDSAK